MPEHFEIWLKTTIPGLFVFTIVGGLATLVVVKILRLIWRALNLPKRVDTFLFSYVKSVALSRVLTHGYIKNRNYFGFLTHSMVAIGGFFCTTILLALAAVLLGVYFIVNGVVFSRGLVVLLSLFGFLGILWLRDLCYLYGLLEQTYFRNFERVKKLINEMHKISRKETGNFAMSDLDELYTRTEERIATRKQATTIEQSGTEPS